MQLICTPHGTVRAIYSDALPLSLIGEIEIRRGSHVEPTRRGQWTADLSPINGPVLGPFDLRGEALTAEVEWLEAHWLPGASVAPIR
mgnify:CR=1 FL=1